MNSVWQPIDAAPKQRTLLGYSKRSGSDWYFETRWIAGRYQYWWGHPTHWMELPEPPLEGSTKMGKPKMSKADRENLRRDRQAKRLARMTTAKESVPQRREFEALRDWQPTPSERKETDG